MSNDDDFFGMTRQYLSEGLAPNRLDKTGHAWLLERTVAFIDASFLHLKPTMLDPDYIYYGLAFADNPCLGRPETFDADHPWGRREPGVRDDLYGKPVDHKDGPWGDVSLRWSENESSPKYVKNWPNLALISGWYFKLPIPFIGQYIFDGGYAGPADQLSHYFNDRSLTVDGTGGSEGSLALGPGNDPTWAVSSRDYAVNLYRLACRFYPLSPVHATLSGLEFKSPGRVVNHVLDANYDVNALPTYLGGNPFVLTPDGKPTWPIWVPKDYSPGKLLQDDPGHLSGAASIYLGWALHLVGDLTVPFHAMSTSGEKHRQCEKEIDGFLNDRNTRDQLDRLPVVSQRTYPLSKSVVYWPTFLTDLENGSYRSRYCSPEALRATLDELAQTSKMHYEDAHPDKRSNAIQTLWAFEYLADMAIKHTVGMILCVDQNERRRGRLMIGDFTTFLATFAGQAMDIPYREEWGQSTLLNGWHDRGDIVLIGDFMRRGHDQVLFLNRSSQKGGRVLIANLSTKRCPVDVLYCEQWGESTALNGWHDVGPDISDFCIAGDFMGCGYDQVLFINRTDQLGGRVMIADFSRGRAPVKALYWENWGQSNILDGWDGGDDIILAGNFLGIGHDQLMFVNQFGQKRVMIADFSSGKAPVQVVYMEDRTTGDSLGGWADPGDIHLVGDFAALGRDQVLLH